MEQVNLSKLKEFSIVASQLTSLPASFGNLSELKNLDIRNNQFRELQEVIGNLTQLRGLDISRNQLTYLPEAIGKLTNLSLLGLESNLLPSDVEEQLMGLMSLPEETFDDETQYKLILKPDVVTMFEIHNQVELQQQINSQALSQLVYAGDPDYDYDYDEEEDEEDVTKETTEEQKINKENQNKIEEKKILPLTGETNRFVYSLAGFSLLLLAPFIWNKKLKRKSIK